MNTKQPKFTRNELVYLKVTLLRHRDIQMMFGKKQDKEFARVINKISEDLREMD